METKKFRKIIWDFYGENKRDLPWRRQIDPYLIVVSEIMLQQTQVPRVLKKFPEFVEKFPNWKLLANAPTRDVLKIWSGMGYNRRAIYLRKIAEIVKKKYQGILPKDPKILDTFPGIGKATARSIAAFAYNIPTVFIETNIRRIFIHHFFSDKENISDQEILPIVEKTLDSDNPRKWYWALFDYGTYLSKTINNPNKKSRHYSLQSKFIGSDRQMRGLILKQILQEGLIKGNEFIEQFPQDKDRILRAFTSLKGEGIIHEKNGMYEVK